MLKVFFADAGTLDQLRDNLDRIEAEATARLAALAAMAGSDPLPFPERAHLSALSIRLPAEQERAVVRWARWARKQVAEWESTSDPGTWDPLAHLAEIRVAAGE
jgi:hypothetical protein